MAWNDTMFHGTSPPALKVEVTGYLAKASSAERTEAVLIAIRKLISSSCKLIQGKTLIGSFVCRYYRQYLLRLADPAYLPQRHAGGEMRVRLGKDSRAQLKHLR